MVLGANQEGECPLHHARPGQTEWYYHIVVAIVIIILCWCALPSSLNWLEGMVWVDFTSIFFMESDVHVHAVTQFYLGKSLTVVTEWGEVYSGQASVGKHLTLVRLPGIQNAKAVFTDFKANNLAYIQQLYK